jgi:hypothetical protein
MTADLRERLRIPADRLEAVNRVLCDGDSAVVQALLDTVARYGTIDEINAKARRAGSLEYQMARLQELGSPYLEDLEWLVDQRDSGAFVTMDEYRRSVLGERSGEVTFDQRFAVTLEVSANQYFPWIVPQAKQAIARRELMPGRFIRVRNMKEQVEDHDVIAVGAAMNIIGASYVETLDTRGTDGSNVHLGGPATITGYFGGVGQPNEHALAWLDEFLHYYTTYGVRQVLNVNPGTILLALMLHKLGIENEFKISVYMGHDNPYSLLSTLTMAKLFSRDDGGTALIGLNFANSVNNETIELAAEVRASLGFEDVVRFEHHIVETWKSIVVQPYDRRAELLDLARKVRNISAKHEGGDVEIEQTREHPSDILDYFMPKKDVIENGLWDALERNFLDKHDAVSHTARALTTAGIAVVAARKLHKS